MTKYLVFILGGVISCIPSVVLAVDSDGDGLEDIVEIEQFATDPMNADTDGDGYNDLLEIKSGYSPLTASPTPMHEYDHDGDGLNYWLETQWFRSSPIHKDTDGDGYDDRVEVMSGYDPITAGSGETFYREIVVDRTHQRLYFMVDGVKVENYPVSTGNPGTQTPAGEFTILSKIDVKNYVGADYFVPNVWWNMLFKEGGYYIHGTYWHNDFGKRTHSHGCVNMTVEDAKDLYPFANTGVRVRVIGETPARYVVGS